MAKMFGIEINSKIFDIKRGMKSNIQSIRLNVIPIGGLQAMTVLTPATFAVAIVIILDEI